MERIAAAVVGAGVVGLACARELARRGIETLILERHDSFGCETSSRNSEVIHAGIYYREGSLKATLCVTGKRQLYDFCRLHAVGFRRCGKLIVATSSADEERLANLQRQGEANGVEDLRWLSSAEVLAVEPELACSAALLSPSTGIIDSHGLMLALLGDAERAGAVLARRSPLLGGVIEADGIVLECGGNDPLLLHCRLVINAAGPWAADVAGSLDGFPPAALPAMHYAKGNYCALVGRAPFSRLVYPLPETGGLGIHLTLDLAGQARFGPDVEWLPDPPPGGAIGAFDYSVSHARAEAFETAIRRYWPGLPAGRLQPAYSGVRPKLAGRAAPVADFLIQGPAQHAIPGLVNLFGIESPGLTACLAIADRVVSELSPR